MPTASAIPIFATPHLTSTPVTARESVPLRNRCFSGFYLIWTEHSLLSVFWTANATAPCRALFCVYVVPFLAIFSFPFHYSVLSFERREWRLPMGHAYDLCVDTTLAVNGSAIDWQWRWFHCRCRAFEEFSPFSFVCHSLIPTSSREKSYSHYNVL